MSILIIARNNLHLTKKAVASALAQDYKSSVLVIDNASTDGTKEWLRSKGDIACRIMVKQESLADCWNMGLQTIWNFNHQPVLVLNNDVEIRPDTYGVLKRYYWQAMLPTFVTGVSVRSPEEMQKKQIELTESPHPDFSCFLIGKPIYEVAGPFDGDFYPAYFEDNDYHVRMHRAGVHAVSIDLPFLHHGAQTLSSASIQEKKKIQRGFDKCKSLFKSKYGCVPGTPEYDALFTSSEKTSLSDPAIKK